MGPDAARRPIARNRSLAFVPWEIGVLGPKTDLAWNHTKEFQVNGASAPPPPTVWQVCADGQMEKEGAFLEEPTMKFTVAYQMVPELRVVASSPHASPCVGLYRWSGLFNGRPHYRMVDVE